MELRHLRYFVAVAEALNFTKAAAQLRVAQPALGRQVQDLEEEIGVDLFKRSPRGVTLTAEGKLFLEEAREILKRAEESVEKVRALARGDFGEVHVGYAPSPSVEILPPALSAFKKASPSVRIVLHDLGGDELMARLLDGSIELAITVAHPDDLAQGIEFEALHEYPFCVAMAPDHPFARKKSISLEEAATHPVVGLIRREYTQFYRYMDRMYAGRKARPKIVIECDGSTSMVTEIEGSQYLGIVSALFRHIGGKRLVYRPLSNSQEFHTVGIARAKKGDVTPAAEKLCAVLREVAKGLGKRKE
jgi:DNA-binding transcriptional LysR family regulator